MVRKKSTEPLDIQSCVICFEDFGESTECTLDGCAHRYHLGCIRTWSQVENTCALCKKRFSHLHLVYKDGRDSETIRIHHRTQSEEDHAFDAPGFDEASEEDDTFSSAHESSDEEPREASPSPPPTPIVEPRRLRSRSQRLIPQRYSPSACRSRAFSTSTALASRDTENIAPSQQPDKQSEVSKRPEETQTQPRRSRRHLLQPRDVE